MFVDLARHLTDDPSYDIPAVTVRQYINGAIISIFAFLVPLLTMEINYFRLAVYRAWYYDDRRRRRAAREERRLQHKKWRLQEQQQQVSFEQELQELRKQHQKLQIQLVEENENSFKNKNESNNSLNIDNGSVKNSETVINNDDKNDDESNESICSNTSMAVAFDRILMDNIISNVINNSIMKSRSGESCRPGVDSESRMENDNSNLKSDPENSPTNEDTALIDKRVKLQKAYHEIRRANLQALITALVIYSITAAIIALNTRGLEEKVTLILGGVSTFLAAVVLVIVSAKIPQWLGVYHNGSILLVKSSSEFSQHVENIDLTNESHLVQLRINVRMGVWFHFSKFYIILMPFYCGANVIVVPLSIIIGVVAGFIMMWCVFVVRKKYIRHRNSVSFSTIFILNILSSLTFVRGVAYIRVVWRLDLVHDDDVLMIASFFSWLAVLTLVHILFLRHTVKTERKARMKRHSSSIDSTNDVAELAMETNMPKRMSWTIGSSFPEKSQYDSHLFDPRTHFKDGKSRFSELSEFDVRQSEYSMDDFNSIRGSRFSVGDRNSSKKSKFSVGSLNTAREPRLYLDDFPLPDRQSGSRESLDSTKYAGYMANVEMTVNSDQICYDRDVLHDAFVENRPWHDTKNTPVDTAVVMTSTKRKCPAWCEVFVCFSPKYLKASMIWKITFWLKIVVVILSYLLFLYFVIVCIGATYQVNRTRRELPEVQVALYSTQNTGPVCAFDNRGANSNITTFDNKDAAHDAGFSVLHCGACAACSSWNDLIVEYDTRDTLADLANKCAKKSLFKGKDGITECLMEKNIGFGKECAVCWMEDIVCTKAHCAFIFLQAQMINNVGNFAVGPNDITSATCEEAHCEVDLFVPCSGATRRRMNIVSSIARPSDQQCAVVDVKDWEDLFHGSGVIANISSEVMQL